MTPAEKLAKSKGAQQQTAFRELPIVFECRLKAKREALGLSQRDVCRATRLNVSTVCRVEQGVDLTLSRALRLATFFGCPIEQIWKATVSDD